MYIDHDQAEIVLHDLIFIKNCSVKYDPLYIQFYITKGNDTFTLGAYVVNFGDYSHYMVSIKEYENLLKHMEKIYD